MKLVRLAAVAVAVFMLAGCATIIRGTEQNISVNTNPVGAQIDFSNGQGCTSPCTLKVKRDTALQLTIRMDGCATQTASMIPTLAGGGVILGGIIDYGTGAVYDLQPNPLTITLNCQGVPVGSPQTNAGPVARPVASGGAFPPVQSSGGR